MNRPPDPAGATAGLADFLEALSRPDPVPGGGTASAVAGAMAAALTAMVAGLSTDPKRFAAAERMTALEAEARAARDRFVALADRDAQAFAAVMAAYRLPRGTDAEKAARSLAIQQGLAGATEPPLEVCRGLVSLAQHVVEVWRDGNPRARSDVATGYHLARAGFWGARENVEVNCAALKDEDFVGRVRAELAALEARWPAPPA